MAEQLTATQLEILRTLAQGGTLLVCYELIPVDGRARDVPSVAVAGLQRRMMLTQRGLDITELGMQALAREGEA